MPKVFSYIVRVETYGPDRRESATQRAGLADMLRYDVATIAESMGTGLYRIEGTHAPTIGRWQSFGIAVSDVSASQRKHTRCYASGWEVDTMPNVCEAYGRVTCAVCGASVPYVVRGGRPFTRVHNRPLIASEVSE